jgi:predicted anti-sigma-YlaC factor YlaD
MDCQRAEELLSDRLEGSLHPILGAELEAHLASCEACRELLHALTEVVGALRDAPELEAPRTLAERAASAALARPRTIEIRPAFVVPHWLNAAAAGFALIALGATLAVVGPERGARAAQRLVGQTVTAGTSLMERKDRLLEDVRVLGVVLSTAFEGRIERVNERVNDYKRLLERRKPSPPPEPKQGSEIRPAAVQVAAGFRTSTGSGS